MEKHIMVVFTNAVDGQEEEFNRWYDRQHLGDVVAIKGFKRAARYRLADEQLTKAGPYKYLAIYELETDDLRGALDALNKAVADGMDMSPSLDMTDLRSWVFTPVDS